MKLIAILFGIVLLFPLGIVFAYGDNVTIEVWQPDIDGLLIRNLAIDSEDNIYLALTSPVQYPEEKIRKFDKNGDFLFDFGERGHEKHNLSKPYVIEAGILGYIFVTRIHLDYKGIQVFNFLGDYKTTLPLSPYIDDMEVSSSSKLFTTGGNYVEVYSYHAKKLFEFGGTCDFSDIKVIKEYLEEDLTEYWEQIYQERLNSAIEYCGGTYGTQNFGDGKFARIGGIAIDSDSNIYVVDGGNDRIQKFDNEGNFLLKWTPKSPEKHVYLSSPIEIDENNFIYIATLSGGIQKFDANGNLISVFGERCSDFNPGPLCKDPDGDGPLPLGYFQYSSVYDIELDSEGTLYLLDGRDGGYRILKFFQDPQTQNLDERQIIPNWIRNNAKWWSAGQIGDNDFVSGIQFLIQNDIMRIPSLPEQASETAQENVPDWVRNNAEWWSQGLISDDDFINGIKHLVEKGIIRV